jgi:hypothetical protein
MHSGYVTFFIFSCQCIIWKSKLGTLGATCVVLVTLKACDYSCNIWERSHSLFELEGKLKLSTKMAGPRASRRAVRQKGQVSYCFIVVRTQLLRIMHQIHQ